MSSEQEARSSSIGSCARSLGEIRHGHPWTGPPVGILWDQSLVWGILCVETLAKSGVPFRLLSASDVGAGCLDAYRILLVPGGWAAHKVRALGESGRKRIARFIDEGGSYIGFCGGAGLALSSPPALNLTSIRRMPLPERLPSASGEVFVAGMLSHPAWKDILPEIAVSVWWPSQFQWAPECNAVCLASYTNPGTGFQVADLRVSDLNEEVCWEDLEKAYGINLNPARIKGHPAIIEVPKGEGRLILSYAHLETPGDTWGNRLLLNILDYLDKASAAARSMRPHLQTATDNGQFPAGQGELPDEQCWKLIVNAGEAASELITFGEANLLWNWRKPWLLNWRRGIRGLEYGTLAVALNYMVGLREKLQDCGQEPSPLPAWSQRAEKLERTTKEFCALAKSLLMEEKMATQTGILSKLGKVNERVDPLRGALFGNRMNHGGLAGTLFDLIDRMLLDIIRLTGSHRS